MKKIKLYTDGGSRGNPGPAALGVVIESESAGKKIYGEYLGERTNNQAEYEAVIFGLKKIKHMIGGDMALDSEIEIYLDSELIVKQINGEYKIKEKEIRNLFIDVWNLRLDFKSVRFIHVPREKNAEADAAVNQVLDREANKLNI